MNPNLKKYAVIGFNGVEIRSVKTKRILKTFGFITYEELKKELRIKTNE